MKSFLKVLMLFGCAATLSLLGCKNDNNNDDDDNPQPQSSMTAKVDGTAWSASTVGATMQGGITNITGVASDGSVITLTLNGQTEGTYTLEHTSSSVGVYSDQVNASWASNQAFDVTASVNVTDINFSDSTISGEFQFIPFRLIDNTEKVITEGKFTNVPFSTVITTGGDNFMKAKIDGAVYEAAATIGSLNFGILQVTGASADGHKAIGLFLSPDITMGEHNLEAFGSTNFAQYNPNDSTFLSSDSGKVDITVHDKTAKLIEGTFHFEASQLGGGASASITVGQFKAAYQ